jgi:hypothetical protein
MSFDNDQYRELFIEEAKEHIDNAGDNAQEDLDIEINQGTCNILMEYAKLDKLDLIIVLQIKGATAKWCLMSVYWLRKQYPIRSNKGYIV